MPVQTRLGGWHTGGLELGNPSTVNIVMTNGGVDILEDCLVNLVGVVGQHGEYQPGWTIDMDLRRIDEIVKI